MAQCVWADVGGGELQVAGLGLVFADDPRDAATTELGSVLVEEHRMVVVAGPVRSDGCR